MKFKFPMYLTMISALAFSTVGISEVQAQMGSYGGAAPATSMMTAAPAPVCCQNTMNYSNQSCGYSNQSCGYSGQSCGYSGQSCGNNCVSQTGPIPSYRAVQFSRNNPEATYNPHSDELIAAPVTHRGMTYVPLFSRSTNRTLFRNRRAANTGPSAYSY